MLEFMVRAAGWVVLCALAVSCAARQREWEPAGSGASLLAKDRSIEQTFETDDQAAKTACTWLRNNEPKSERWEYCGSILLVPGGYMATVPMTIHEPTRCPRTVPGPPGQVGWYHSHVKTNEFSPPDKLRGVAIANYLCAPNGLVKKLTLEGTVILP